MAIGQEHSTVFLIPPKNDTSNSPEVSKCKTIKFMHGDGQNERKRGGDEEGQQRPLILMVGVKT